MGFNKTYKNKPIYNLIKLILFQCLFVMIFVFIIIYHTPFFIKLGPSHSESQTTAFNTGFWAPIAFIYLFYLLCILTFGKKDARFIVYAHLLFFAVLILIFAHILSISVVLAFYKQVPVSNILLHITLIPYRSNKSLFIFLCILILVIILNTVALLHYLYYYKEIKTLKFGGFLDMLTSLPHLNVCFHIGVLERDCFLNITEYKDGRLLNLFEVPIRTLIYKAFTNLLFPLWWYFFLFLCTYLSKNLNFIFIIGISNHLCYVCVLKSCTLLYRSSIKKNTFFFASLMLVYSILLTVSGLHVIFKYVFLCHGKINTVCSFEYKDPYPINTNTLIGVTELYKPAVTKILNNNNTEPLDFYSDSVKSEPIFYNFLRLISSVFLTWYSLVFLIVLTHVIGDMNLDTILLDLSLFYLIPHSIIFLICIEYLTQDSVFDINAKPKYFDKYLYSNNFTKWHKIVLGSLLIVCSLIHIILSFWFRQNTYFWCIQFFVLLTFLITIYLLEYILPNFKKEYQDAIYQEYLYAIEAFLTLMYWSCLFYTLLHSFGIFVWVILSISGLIR